MDKSGGPSLASSPVSAKAEPSRPRRKLQKGGGTRHRDDDDSYYYYSTKPSSPAVSSHAPPRRNKPGPAKLIRPPPLPSADPRDSKAPGYLRRGGYFSTSLDSVSAQSSDTLTAEPPASFLVSGRRRDCRGRNRDKEKPAVAATAQSPWSSSRSAYPSLPSLLSLLSSSPSTMRRRAKTPVFSVGQLETSIIEEPSREAATRTAEVATNNIATEKKASVELIAEQYRALLDRRDSIFTDSHSEPPPSPARNRRLDESPAAAGTGKRLQLRRSTDLRGTSSAQGPQAASDSPSSSASPTSDDGTLVSFEEETVYFKPVSFSPEPPSPVHGCNSNNNARGAGSGNDDEDLPPTSPSWASPSPPPLAPECLSLQICVDLLARDLASAVAGNNNCHGGSGGKPRKPTDTSSSAALQVWVMIEAYERLRDQISLLASTLSCDAAVALEATLDAWLRALYSVHDSLAGGDREGGTGSEGEYEVLELAIEEDLD